MKTSKALPPIIRMAKYTIIDEVRQKSFVIMFAICAIFILLIRGCYQGNYIVNGQALDAGSVIRVVSKATFHVIAAHLNHERGREPTSMGDAFVQEPLVLHLQVQQGRIGGVPLQQKSHHADDVSPSIAAVLGCRTSPHLVVAENPNDPVLTGAMKSDEVVWVLAMRNRPPAVIPVEG